MAESNTPESVDTAAVHVTIKGRIKAGDNLDVSLKRNGIKPAMRAQIISTLSKSMDLKQLRPGDRYSVVLDDTGEMTSCTYESGPLDIYEISRSEDGFSVVKLDILLECRTVKIAGQIESSLFATIQALGEEPQLIYGFANIFASKIDFNTEIRQGDQFSLVVEKYFKNDEFVGYGKLLAATYVQKSQTLEGFYYSSKKIAGSYFDRTGEELGTMFIRSPVPVGRVSSTFTYKRKHPITGRVQPHLGIDLAAPIGTPIMAASSGTIKFMGREGGFGNHLILEHSGGYKTYYGHLAGFKKGLKRGQRVKQKEIIGYVGSTGRSTGPHLDYRISLNNSFKDPFSLKFKARSNLSGKDLASFQKVVAAVNDLSNSRDTEQPLLVKTVVLNQESDISFL